MVYVVVTFLLSRRAGWSVPFTVLSLAAGLIPLIIFWVERRVVHRMRAEHPELGPADAEEPHDHRVRARRRWRAGRREVGMLQALFERGSARPGARHLASAP